MKLLNREQLTAASGVARWVTHLNGDLFATVSREWVAQVWAAGVDALRLNAPELVEVRQLSGGRSRLVPRWMLNGFNCRGHSLFIYAHGMTGFARQAALSATPLGHDALAFGWLEYTATPRPENLGRNGRHEHLWFIDHDGVFQTFEGGDGQENELTPAEIASITFFFAQ